MLINALLRSSGLDQISDLCSGETPCAILESAGLFVRHGYIKTARVAPLIAYGAGVSDEMVMLISRLRCSRRRKLAKRVTTESRTYIEDIGLVADVTLSRPYAHPSHVWIGVWV